jgi:hypothetical protein
VARALAATLLLSTLCGVVPLAADLSEAGLYGSGTAAAFIANDALGPGPVGEWDDLRTFALGLYARLDEGLYLETAYESFTWRGATPSEASRIDALRALLRWKPPGIAAGPLRLEPLLAVGVELLGNLGSALLQEAFHSHVGITRPVPESYDSLATLAPAAGLWARLCWEHGLWRAGLLAGLSGEVPVGFRTGAGVQLAAASGGTGVQATLRYLLDPVRGVSATLDRVSASESGLVVRVDCSAGHLRSSLQHNLSTGVSYGGIGVQLGGLDGGASPGPTPALPLALELFSPLTLLAQGQKLLVPVLGPLVRVFVSQAGGWRAEPSAGATALRFAEYGLGVEGRLLLGLGGLEAQTACGLGPVLTVVTTHTLGEERSTILDSSLLVGLRVAPLLRVGVLQRTAGGRRVVSGVGVALQLDVPLWGSPSAELTAVRVLLFSEGR